MVIAAKMQGMWHQHIAFQFKATASNADLSALTNALAEYVDERQYERAKFCSFLYGYDGSGDFDELLAALIRASMDHTDTEPAREELIQWFVAALRPIQSDAAAIREVLNGNPKTKDPGLVTQFIDVLRKEIEKKPVPRDDGLAISLEEEKQHGEVLDIDEHIRGYAVALKCELALSETDRKIVDRAWITDTAVTYKKVRDNDCAKQYENTKYVLRDESGNPLWTHESVGSAVIDGERLIELLYEADPICAVSAIGAKVGNNYEYRSSGRADVDYDELEGLDYHWYLKFMQGDAETAGGRPIPGLGYGMWYYAVKTAIDNAGVVAIAEFRDEYWPAHLIAVENIKDWDTNLGRYLSLEPPGAPSLIHTIDGRTNNGAVVSDRRVPRQRLWNRFSSGLRECFCSS